MILVFYTSSHGFGHASRDIEVINEVGRRRPDARIVVRSDIATWFFEASVRVPAELQPCECDSGIAQIDSLTLDEDETARRAARFYADFDRRIEAEAEVLQTSSASLVVADIPPLALGAAARAGVPSIALGNFTWDWIYEGYPHFELSAPGAVARIRAAYARATRALRLPLHGGFEPMHDVVEDVPLIARHSALGRDAARRALGLDAHEIVVLASFGGYGLGLDYASIARSSRFRLIVTDHEARDRTSDAHPGRLLRLTSSDLRSGGIHYEDLVAASDIVVSKPGYGIVSECIANGAALLFTSRGHFREHDMLVAEMPEVLRCRPIDQEALRAGRWADAVEALLAQAPPVHRLATNGAAVAAEAILDTASGRI